MARDSDTLSVSNIGGDLTIVGNVTSKGEIKISMATLKAPKSQPPDLPSGGAAARNFAPSKIAGRVKVADASRPVRQKRQKRHTNRRPAQLNINSDASPNGG